MVDLVASNLKLKQRSRNILRKLSATCSSLPDSDLDMLLAQCNHSVKLAILVAETGLSVQSCLRQLEAAGGVLAEALSQVSKPARLPSNSSECARRFVLCIDGGGTKCAAVVADYNGVVGRGSAGPCNL